MSNKHASKQHGLHDIKILQPKSSVRVRRNKAKAAARKAERRLIMFPGQAVNVRQSSKKQIAAAA